MDVVRAGQLEVVAAPRGRRASFATARSSWASTGGVLRGVAPFLPNVMTVYPCILVSSKPPPTHRLGWLETRPPELLFVVALELARAQSWPYWSEPNKGAHEWSVQPNTCSPTPDVAAPPVRGRGACWMARPRARGSVPRFQPVDPDRAVQISPKARRRRAGRRGAYEGENEAPKFWRHERAVVPPLQPRPCGISTLFDGGAG